MAKVLSVLEKNILKAKGLTDADLKKMAASGIRALEDFRVVGDPMTLSELIGVPEPVAKKVMAWALAQLASAAPLSPVIPAPGGSAPSAPPVPLAAGVVSHSSPPAGPVANSAAPSSPPSHVGAPTVVPAAPSSPPAPTSSPPFSAGPSASEPPGLTSSLPPGMAMAATYPGTNGFGPGVGAGNGGTMDGESVLCMHCRAKQPREYKSGDPCVACAKQAELVLTCFWCSASGSGKFCRRCGAEFVPTGELELALLLKREGIPKQDISFKLKALSPDEKEQLWGRVRRYQG